MTEYVIERSFPNAGKLSELEWKEISTKSCGVLRDLGPEVEWIHSYVTEDKLYCVYRAASAEMVLEHARRGGFPVDAVREVRTRISPETAG